MDLRNLTDQTLLDDTVGWAQKSREALTQLLHHLREIERRRLFSKLGYSSLFDYVVKKLNFSEAEAHRRISSMRLLKELPEIEAKISSGALTMTSLTLARTLFIKEKKRGHCLDQKAQAQIISQLEHQSTRSAQKILAQINPEMKKTKSLDFNSIEDEDLRAKLIRVKGLFAHTNPHMTLEELLHKLCDRELDKKTKLPRPSNATSSSPSALTMLFG